MRSERVVDFGTLKSGSELLDDDLLPAASSRFLEGSGHHLLFAWDDTVRPVGFICGIEG
jgi:hypothetical protein